MKHQVIAMKVHSGESRIVENGGVSKPMPMRLPKGCFGFMFVFETKKAAREYWGKDVGLLRIESKGVKKAK